MSALLRWHAALCRHLEQSLERSPKQSPKQSPVGSSRLVGSSTQVQAQSRPADRLSRVQPSQDIPSSRAADSRASSRPVAAPVTVAPSPRVDLAELFAFMIREAILRGEYTLPAAAAPPPPPPASPAAAAAAAASEVAEAGAAGGLEAASLTNDTRSKPPSKPRVSSFTELYFHELDQLDALQGVHLPQRAFLTLAGSLGFQGYVMGRATGFLGLGFGFVWVCWGWGWR